MIKSIINAVSNPELSKTDRFFLGVVHEHPRIGSDGESEEGSGTSEDPNVSPGSEELAAGNAKQVIPYNLHPISSHVISVLLIFVNISWITAGVLEVWKTI